MRGPRGGVRRLIRAGAPAALACAALLAACSSDDPVPPPSPVALGYDAYPPELQQLAPPGEETRRLTDGEPLEPPPMPESERPVLIAQLAAARVAHEHDPGDAGALVTYGRRLGYVGRFRDATMVFAAGCERFPGDARMWRFRGHRWITTS